MNNVELEEPKEKKQKRTRRITKHVLTSAGIETLIQVLKTYVIGTKNGESPIDYQEVASISGLNPSTVSGCNKFFEENGMLILRKRGMYVPSQEIVNFSRELPWDVENAKRKLRNVLKRTWFGELVLKKFELNTSYKESELISSLGKEAGALDDQMASLKRIIELMEYSELIQRIQDTDQYTLESELPSFIPANIQADQIDTLKISDKPEEMSSSSIKYTINLNVNIPEKIDADYVNNLEDLLKRLKNLK